MNQPTSNERLISISSDKCDLVAKVDEHRINLRKTMVSLYAKEKEGLQLTEDLLYQFILADMGIDYEEIAPYYPKGTYPHPQGKWEMKSVRWGKHILQRKCFFRREKDTPQEYRVSTQWEIKLKDTTFWVVDNPHIIENIWKGIDLEKALSSL